MMDQSESLFWDNYSSKTKAYRIKSAAARWYVRHAERYIKAYANLRLARHFAAQLVRGSPGQVSRLTSGREVPTQGQVADPIDFIF